MESGIRAIKIITDNPNLKLEYLTHGASGFDLPSNEELIIMPGEFKGVDTGFKFEIPDTMELQVRPRSGLALKHGITVLNSPGTVDSDYRGNVKVILINHGKDPFHIHVGDRIAQGVFIENSIARVKFDVVDEFTTTTDRGENGFGSTGLYKVENLRYVEDIKDSRWMDEDIMEYYYTGLFQYMATLNNDDGDRFREFIAMVQDRFPKFPKDCYEFTSIKNAFMDLHADTPESAIFGRNFYVSYVNDLRTGVFILIPPTDDSEIGRSLGDGRYGLMGVQKLHNSDLVGKWVPKLIDSFRKRGDIKELLLTCSREVWEKVWRPVGFEDIVYEGPEEIGVLLRFENNEKKIL